MMTVAAGDEKTTQEPKRPSAERNAGDRDVGHALRSVYVETVNEEIPPELLDLLGKLD